MRTYPIAVLGFVNGNVRWETCGGRDDVLYGGPWLFMQYPKGVGADTFAVTHIQKYSRGFGFLLMWPFCFHAWFMWRPQKTDANGTWIPGSEQGIYFRLPGFRWDAGQCRYILTKGYFGLHWD